jgi:hypothetical protein
VRSEESPFRIRLQSKGRIYYVIIANITPERDLKAHLGLLHKEFLACRDVTDLAFCAESCRLNGLSDHKSVKVTCETTPSPCSIVKPHQERFYETPLRLSAAIDSALTRAWPWIRHPLHSLNLRNLRPRTAELLIENYVPFYETRLAFTRLQCPNFDGYRSNDPTPRNNLVFQSHTNQELREWRRRPFFTSATSIYADLQRTWSICPRLHDQFARSRLGKVSFILGYNSGAPINCFHAFEETFTKP